MQNKKFCKYCGEKINKDTIVCPKCGRQLDNIKISQEDIQIEDNNNNSNSDNEKFYEKVWFVILLLVILPPLGVLYLWKFNYNITKVGKIILTVVFSICFLLCLILNNSKTTTEDSEINSLNNNIEIISFSQMSQDEITNWCNENGINCVIKYEYSNTVDSGKFIKQSLEAGKSTTEGSTIKIIYSLGEEPPLEYKNALKKAKLYSNHMYMSEQGIYDQLVSEYGEKFSQDAAQYAIDNLNADYNYNAYKKAQSYQETLNMSKQAIYDQLISNYGEKFTNEEAQYAIDHLE